MIDKDMTEVLQVATAIITNELVSGSEIKIAGFGKFYTTEILVGGKRFGKDTGEEERIVEVVRFKPFTQLKKAINDKETVQVEEPDRDWVKSVGQKVMEGEPERNESDLNTNKVSSELETDATITNEASVKINNVDVTEQIETGSIEVEIENKKEEVKTSEDETGGGLLGDFDDGDSLLF